MKFSEVTGQNHIKAHLQGTLEMGRIPHAQLFSGAVGSGIFPMALAYAADILSIQFEKNSAQHNETVEQVRKLEHPDLHFVFPVNTTATIKPKQPVSDDFIHLWRPFLRENPYSSISQWLQYLDIEKKQGNIAAKEAEEMSKKLSLKAFKGGYKVMIIWLAEYMNEHCANKILKLIEEPEEKTVLLFLSERDERLLVTIHSRLQKIDFPLLSDEDIAASLKDNFNISDSVAYSIASRARGDFNYALILNQESGEDDQFEKWFIEWVRAAYRAKQDRTSILKLLTWSEKLAGQNKDIQKRFLLYCLETFRQALLQNYSASSLVHFQSHDRSFSLKNFSPFVHGNNIALIYDALEAAIYHVERNANPKILFADLSMDLTRFMHRRSQ